MSRTKPPDSDKQTFPLRPPELLAIAAFWVFVLVVAVVTRQLDPRIPGLPDEVTAALTQLTIIEYGLWAAFTPAIIWLGGRFGVERERRLERVILLFSLGVLLAIAVDTTLALARAGLLPPLPSGRRPGPPLGFVDDLMVYLALVLFGVARNYYLRFQTHHDETVALAAHAAQLQAQLAEARLSALRSQLNPHFLFNTLNAVSALVESDPRGVRRMIARLSELLRHTLEGSKEAEIPLDRELDLLQRYLDIMQIRFEGRLDVVTDIAPDVRSALVPNLILQPLVENAIKHGIDAVGGRGRIELQALKGGMDKLVLTVRDSGAGTGADSPVSDGGGFGLRNTRARLEQLYGAGQTFQLKPADGGGMIAEIEMPLRFVNEASRA